MLNSNHNLDRVESTMDAMRRAMVGVRERFSAGLQLTRTQLEILIMLVDKPQTTGELARRLFLTQSAVTQTIDTLARRALIERHPDQHDRRITQLHLSPAGQEITSHVRTLRHEYLESLVESLTEQEIEVLISLTEKFTAHIITMDSTSKEINKGEQI